MSLVPWMMGAWTSGAGEIRLAADPRLLVLAGVLAFLTWGFSFLTAPRGKGRFAQALLLLPALLALLVILARPERFEDQGRLEPGRFVILVDDSLSMATREGRDARSDEVPAILQTIGRPGAERFLFGAELGPGAEPSFAASDTDLGAALEALRIRFAGERLAGIAVITDGIDRGALRRDWQAGQGLPAVDAPGPLTLYGVGRATSLVDLSVEALDAGGFAFIRAPFTLGVSLLGRGYEGRKVPVTLTRDGAFEARKEVTLDREGRARLSFEVTPTRVGRAAWAISVPVSDDDAVPANNTASVVVRVVRDRMRVLQVCGSPSSDQKFMRLFLKQDPAVDLVSFFILRTDADLNAGYAPDELSLIPFPYEQLFSSDLWTFDLVVFQNFDYRPYFRWDAEELLGNVADYVRQGGGFVMIGGDRSFDLGQYAGTSLEEILPVKLGVTGDPVDVARFRPNPTEAGLRHPITALSVNADESRALWKSLSPLDGMNLSLGAAPGAATLLVHPTRKDARGRPLPVLAIRTVKKGRSMAFMGDSSWRWSFAEAGLGHGNQAYLRFWKNAMRWLVGDPDAQRLTVETSEENYRVGDEVRILIRARDLGFQALSGIEVEGRVEAPGAPEAATSEENAASDLADPVTGAFAGRSSAEGELGVKYRATRSGAHRVRVRATQADGQVFGEAETVFAVSTRDPELDEILPDPAFLEALAQASGGRFDPSGQARAPLVDTEAGRRVESIRVTPLWDAPFLALISGLFASLSWWVRRRAGGR